MIELSDIKTGTQMLLQPESAADGDPAFELGTKFEAGHGNGRFSVYAPIWQGGYYYISTRDNVRVTFLFDNVRYVFESRVVESYKRGEISFLAMEMTTPIAEVQLRENFRLPVSDDAKIIFHEDDGAEMIKQIRSVRLRDLSGGGVGFYTDWDPGRLTEIMMELRFDSSVQQISAEIRRVDGGASGTGHGYSVGAKFNFDSEREKEQVIRHIFRMQKKMIQEHGRKSV